MEPFIPFASSYANGVPSWHHGGHFDRSFHGDSGYASEDPDFGPVPLLERDHVYENIDQGHHDSPRRWRQRAAALVNAQWSRPMASRANHPLHNSYNDGWRPYDLPQPLAFEQQGNSYEFGPRLRPSAFYNRTNISRKPGHRASRWHFEENIPPVAFDEHRARIPDALPSLSKRIESETDLCSLFSSPSRHGSSSPEAKLKAPQSRRSTTCTHHGHRRETGIRSSGRHQGHHQSSSHDAQLAAAWQQLYQERTELDKERRDMRKKERSLLQRKERRRSSRRDGSDDVTGEGSDESHDRDGTAKNDEGRG